MTTDNGKPLHIRMAIVFIPLTLLGIFIPPTPQSMAALLGKGFGLTLVYGLVSFVWEKVKSARGAAAT